MEVITTFRGAIDNYAEKRGQSSGEAPTTKRRITSREADKHLQLFGEALAVERINMTGKRVDTSNGTENL